MLSARPDYTPAQVDATLKATAVDLGDAGPDARFGAGRLDVGAAVAFAAGGGDPDVVPPSVAIAGPQAQSVQGVVDIDAVASDNVGVARVDFLVNGTKLGSVARPPYHYGFDTTVYGKPVQLTAVARDAAGNVATSAPVTVTIANPPPPDQLPPWITLQSPGAGPLTKDVVITATAGDNVGVTRVDFRVDGSNDQRGALPVHVDDGRARRRRGDARRDGLRRGGEFDVVRAACSDGVESAAASSRPRPRSRLRLRLRRPRRRSRRLRPRRRRRGCGPVRPRWASSAPGNNAMVTAYVTVVTAAVGDDAATALTQTLYVDGRAKRQVRGRTLEFVWSARNLPPGAHRLTIVVRDATGRTATADLRVMRK